MARPVRSDYDNPGQFAQALREYEAANPTTPVELSTLANEAAGYSGDAATAQYIRDLQAGVNVGAGTVQQRTDALNVLIQQGKDRNLAERGSVTAFPGAVSSAVSSADPVDPVPGGTRADAKNTIRAVLATYGLGELSDYLYGVYARGEVNINNPDAIIFAIRGQDAYKKTVCC
jgi:hypothetical protein